MNDIALSEVPIRLDSSPPQRRRSRGLVDEVVESIAGQIRDGILKTGDKLPSESEIMGQYDVSRTVVREALSKLQAGALVETRHGIGTFVLAAEPENNFTIPKSELSTVADVIALLELRISLETEASGLAAQRRSEKQLAAMEAALNAFASAIEKESDAVASDFDFHIEVARATGNIHFANLMAYLGTAIIPRTRVNSAVHAQEERSTYLRRVHQEHESIYSAIRNQDADAARAAMRTHLSNSRERLRQSQQRLIA
jgi:GntR family transcriptional regulator, transcriptional repressor for pyruvate dehydrogenase complex